MKDYEVTIKDKSISVKTKEFKELIDPDTNERVKVPVSAHRKALGLGDFKGDALKYKQAVKDMLKDAYGEGFSELLSDKARVEQELESVTTAHDKLVNEFEAVNHDLSAMMDERNGVLSELEATRLQLATEQEIRKVTEDQLIELTKQLEALQP